MSERTEKGRRLQELRSAYTRLNRLLELVMEEGRFDVADELTVAVRQTGFAISVYEQESEV